MEKITYVRLTEEFRIVIRETMAHAYLRFGTLNETGHPIAAAWVKPDGGVYVGEAFHASGAPVTKRAVAELQKVA